LGGYRGTLEEVILTLEGKKDLKKLFELKIKEAIAARNPFFEPLKNDKF
jgi:hypothetical protein